MPQNKPVARPKTTPVGRPKSSALSRLGITFLTALSLSVLFAGYCVATRSLRAQPVRPRIHEQAEQPTLLTAGDRPAQIARLFLKERPWAESATNQGCTVDKTTFYYFQVWKQESETVVRLEPFALVSKRKDAKPGDRPYSVCAEKAVITFAHKVSLLGGNPGAIVRAELEGDVLIEGPNNLRVDGRNFYFQKGDPNVVYSDDRLRFRADHHFGKAKGMSLVLLRDEKAKPDDPISIGGISSIKLLQDVDMTLVSDSFEQSLTPGKSTKPAAPRDRAAKSAPGRAQPVHCQSVGSFTFVLASREATFERNVRIRRETEPARFDRGGRPIAAAKSDYLAADDNVRILFDSKKPANQPGQKPTAAAKEPSSSSETFGSNLSFKEVHARGKTVTLISQTNGLKALMRDLDYDRTARQARLSAAPNRVQILHNGDRLSAPYIQLDHDESGQEITQVWCRGEGDMRHTDEKTHEVDMTADWKKEMRKHFDPQSGFDLVDLEEAMLEQPKEASGIAADHITLFLERQNPARRAARANMPPTTRGAQTGSGPQLHHMIAVQKTEKVAMVSRQLEAESKRLEIWFDEGPAGSPKAGNGQPRSRANLVPTAQWVANADAPPEPAGAQSASPAYGGVRSAAVAPKPSTAPPSLLGLPQSGDSTEPYVLKADEIVVHVLRGAPNAPAQVSTMVSKGSVHLTQAQKDGAQPLAIDGDMLEVLNRGPNDQLMTVHGQPGHVSNRGSNIEGSRIIFDRAKNTSDVDGAGRLQLPVKQSSEPGQPERTTPFDVNWSSKMHFDGQMALFNGDVRSKINDGEENTEVRCRQMGVTLSRPFSFSQERKDQEQPEVETIDCWGGVHFDSKTTEDGKVMEIRVGVFAQLHVHKPTGKTEAQGPGLLRVWRYNENGQSGFSQITNVQSNAPPKSRKKTAWEFMQVQFRGQMEGDFRQMLSQPPRSPRPSGSSEVVQTSHTGRHGHGRSGGPGNSIIGANGAWTTVFHDHVEVLYGPVEDYNVMVSRDYLQDQAGYLSCETLRVDQHPQSATADQYLTMRATGNSRIEGKDFFGEAETISYDGSKTQYVLRGDGNRLARMWRQQQVGGEPSSAYSNQIFFDPEHNTMRQDAMSKLDWVR
ncbi:MAG TPA: hypothetical protein VHX68_10240 [Planctomycetaceae bacterium]|jgi:lipopolysaccharide export system protein LptA|nr:hypothetical protein [Planctomycetaceae bacterium]